MAFFLFQIEAFIISEKNMDPKFSFWVPRALAKFCFLRIVLKSAKFIPVLVGTTHGEPEHLEMRRTYAQ